MTVLDTDISWPVLRRIVQDWAGTAAELSEVKPLEGGCINTTLALLTATGERAVIKISPHRVNRDYEREAHQLSLLREHGLPAPRVHKVHTGTLDEPNSYLLMEFMPGVDLNEAKRLCTAEEYDQLQANLADLVVTMHERTSTHYHRIRGDEGLRYESWPEFYRKVYDPIWAELEKSNMLPIKSRKLVTKVHERLERLVAHDDCPRLVHWDIWATNLLACPDEHGNWRISALLDPNCKFAHAEAEIAYMDLFHTITPAFLKAYQQRHKLSPDYHRVRKRIYQLYPLINHVRLFGSPYLKPLTGVLELVGAVV
jgi:fructosamine-3-kinase